MPLRHRICAVLTLLRLHSQDCEHCGALQECWGLDMRRRLMELNEPASHGSERTAAGDMKRSENDAA